MSSEDRVAETHSAWVVLLGDRAYKVKKPVKLEFLDFSTRQAREAAARREVELNQRLAPDVYLGVAEVRDPDGDPCEHVIVMRRMPDERRLSSLVTAGVPLDREVRDIARLIAAFHERAATSPEIARVGSPATISAKLEDDLRQMQAFARAILDESALEEVGKLARCFVRGRTRLFEARMADGCIRDGHGDLLADDIFCLPDGPRVIDCLDFDDELRYGDVVADIGFLAMDLERLGAPELASKLLAWYTEFSGTRAPSSLVEYYVAARALVRSKVASIRVTQSDDRARKEADLLLELARRHLRRGKVRLVLVGGPPGTGKTTLAAALADRLGWVALHSDELRKDLVGLGHDTRAEAPVGEGIYDRETTEAMYAELLRRAASMLELGESVILDASWSSATHRADAALVAAATSTDLIEIRCDAPRRLTDRRIVGRSRAHQASDATPAVAAAMRAHFDAWPSSRVVRTGRSIARALKDALVLVEMDERRQR